jgi:hypothetical protein
MFEAFEKACVVIVKEDSNVFDQPTIQAIGSSAACTPVSLRPIVGEAQGSRQRDSR